jgi:hypothetical protein
MNILAVERQSNKVVVTTIRGVMITKNAARVWWQLNKKHPVCERILNEVSH